MPWVTILKYGVPSLIGALVVLQILSWRNDAQKLAGVETALSNLQQEVARNEAIVIEHEKTIAKIRADARKHRQAVSRELGADAAYGGAIPDGGLRYLKDAAQPAR